MIHQASRNAHEEEVERIVTDELGVRLSKTVSSFDPMPLAAASLGQVHSATGGFWLVITILVQNHHTRKKPPQ